MDGGSSGNVRRGSDRLTVGVRLEGRVCSAIVVYVGIDKTLRLYVRCKDNIIIIGCFVEFTIAVKCYIMINTDLMYAKFHVCWCYGY